MARVLIIGGYGGFGARLSRRLAARGHALIIAGRTAARAQAFCAGVPSATPCVMERTRDIAAVLEREKPDLVIDAAGPFQQSGYEVPSACIAAGTPYLDLADSTEFVIGIETLQRAALEAGTPIISGASTVPALTGAVARRLAVGLDETSRVDIALSAANGATGGPSVVAAILSYVGKPIRLWRGRRWTQGYGWQEIRRQDFVVGKGRDLCGRWVALADVPDCRLLPTLLRGNPSVTFRAGTELGIHMLGLWLASWLVRWGWVRSLFGARNWLLPVYRLTRSIGGQRSAIRVSLIGSAGQGAVQRDWTLVAERGEGVEVPTLAAELLAEEVLAGRCPAGAMTASTLLTFAQFEPRLSQLALSHAFSERALPPPLHRRVIGRAFDDLPLVVQRLHDGRVDSGAMGESRVTRGPTRVARLLAKVMRMPEEGVWQLHVTFAAMEGKETWTRDFGGHLFTSELSQSGKQLVERFGPMRFRFDLSAGEGGLGMRLRGWSIFGIALPSFLAPSIDAQEWEERGRFNFAVAVTAPLVGSIVGYSGWLMPVVGSASEDRTPVAA